LAFVLSSGVVHAADDLAIEHQGTARHYLMHRPSRGENTALPAVIYLYGLRPADWKNHTQVEVDTAADREAMQVHGKAADDVGFISNLLDELVGRKIVDPTRIYVIGDSRGGLMTFEIMCRPIQHEACKPSVAVPILVVAGVNDPIQPHDGWLTEIRRLLSIPETMEFWRQQHGCTGQTRKPLLHRNELWEWSGCKTLNAVKLYRVAGGDTRSFYAGEPGMGEAGRCAKQGHRNDR
jgi:poly(3-hydroxybutyrate) depolymerase